MKKKNWKIKDKFDSIQVFYMKEGKEAKKMNYFQNRNSSKKGLLF